MKIAFPARNSYFQMKIKNPAQMPRAAQLRVEKKYSKQKGSTVAQEPQRRT